MLARAFLVEAAGSSGFAGVDVWPALWLDTLVERSPDSTAPIAASCGDGLLRMYDDRATQIADAQHTAVNGLLSGFTPKPTVAEFVALIPVVLTAVARLPRRVTAIRPSR